MLIQLNFMIHIGRMIHEEMLRQERTPTWLARKICCERTNVYHIFARQSVDTEMLRRISIALHHDFFREYSDSLGDSMRDDY